LAGNTLFVNSEASNAAHLGSGIERTMKLDLTKT